MLRDLLKGLLFVVAVFVFMWFALTSWTEEIHGNDNYIESYIKTLEEVPHTN